MKKTGAAEIVANRELANPEYRELVLNAPEVADRAVPGQFVHVRLASALLAPLLRRPFGIAGRSGGEILILMKIRGGFTRIVAGMKPGEILDLIGPLGNGFRKEAAEGTTAILVAGGYGIAPLLNLAESLRGHAARVVLLEGARTASHLLWKDRIVASGAEARYATDDGSEGFKGTVVDLGADVIRRIAGARTIFACGPNAMLSALVARFPGVPVQASVESRMACGTGLCQGCAVPLRGIEGHGRYVRACVEGPVFDGATVDWDAFPAP